jgi:GDP-L-fucose synthase
MKVLLTGANGFIARNLKDYFVSDSFEISFLHRGIADLTDRQQVNNYFKDKYFDAIIHCASVGGNRTRIDDSSCLNTNLSMFYNLIQNQDKFSKFISLGSGAELDRSENVNQSSNLMKCFPSDEYGMSKNIIAKIGLQLLNFYNVRIFNIFNHDELDSRMIKGNIKNYILGKRIIIHKDKYMDFFYMYDLYLVLKNIILSSAYPKTLDCCYSDHFKLSEIANKINMLSDYKVEVFIENENLDNEYIGNSKNLYSCDFIKDLKGLDAGLIETYKRLLSI